MDSSRPVNSGGKPESEVITKPIPTVNSLTVDEFAQLHLQIARQQRREAQAEEDNRQALRDAYEAELKHQQDVLRKSEAKANELPQYHFRLRYMTMFSVENVVMVLVSLAVSTGFIYVVLQAVSGNNLLGPGQDAQGYVMDIYLPLGIMFAVLGLGKLGFIIIDYRGARLSIQDGFLVYTSPRIPWLLMFGGSKSAKKITLRQAATADFQQNPIESLFNMDSTSFVLDTAAREASVFKKLRGVPHQELLERHLARTV